MGYSVQGPRIRRAFSSGEVYSTDGRAKDTHRQRAIIPGLLYVYFAGMRPHFSMRLGNHVTGSRSCTQRNFLTPVTVR
jgi:hypothetical protein